MDENSFLFKLSNSDMLVVFFLVELSNIFSKVNFFFFSVEDKTIYTDARLFLLLLKDRSCSLKQYSSLFCFVLFCLEGCVVVLVDLNSASV